MKVGSFSFKFKGLWRKEILIKEDTDCVYPVGASFNRNRDYIVEVARTIHTIAGKEGCISLICE